MPDFLPRRDDEFNFWSANFDRIVSSSYAELGLSADQAAQYHEAQQRFDQAFKTISSDATRTPTAIITKDQARAAVTALARVMAGQLRANPNVTSEQRLSLKLSLPRNGRRAKLPVPTEAPVVHVYERDGSRIRVRVKSLISRTKPAEAKGSMIYTFAGERPPLALTEWDLAASTTRIINDLEFPSSLPPGTCIWIIACWQNPTGGCGPISPPVRTFLAGGGVGRVKQLAAA